MVIGVDMQSGTYPPPPPKKKKKKKKNSALPTGFHFSQSLHRKQTFFYGGLMQQAKI